MAAARTLHLPSGLTASTDEPLQLEQRVHKTFLQKKTPRLPVNKHKHGDSAQIGFIKFHFQFFVMLSLYLSLGHPHVPFAV